MEIKAVNISKVYRTGWMRRSHRLVIENVNLTLFPGQRVGIVGPSGSGKTTLGLILAGILKPDRGQLYFGQTDLWKAEPKRRRRLGQQMQMIFQHPESTFDPRWTMARSLAEAFTLRNKCPGQSELTEMLQLVMLDKSLLDRRPAQLSGGELQRMAIARALAMQPQLLILDEPTAMLDVLTQAHIFKLLEDIQEKRGIRMVLISHDPALVDRFCDTLYPLEAMQFGATR